MVLNSRFVVYFTYKLDRVLAEPIKLDWCVVLLAQETPRLGASSGSRNVAASLFLSRDKSSDTMLPHVLIYIQLYRLLLGKCQLINIPY